MTTKADRETYWQRTMRVFLGSRIRVKLRSGGYLEGEPIDPQAYTFKLKLLAGETRLVDYSTVVEVETAQ